MTAERHGKKSLGQRANYKFTAGFEAVPLNVTEFGWAMKSYPIVFSGDETVVPLAVLGFRDDENLFVDSKGNWAKHHYVPAFIRRYPFALAPTDDDNLILCVDETADTLVDGGKRPLFDNGRPSEMTTAVLEFCQAYEGQFQHSRAFAKDLNDRKLLIENGAEATLKSGKKLALGGFRVIDQSQFDALSDDVFAEWRRRGWLSAVYCHLFSLTNWHTLFERAQDRRR